MSGLAYCDCLPLVGALVLSACLLPALMRASGARLSPRVLMHLARDERGSVQSLSFVLTVPVFIMVLMFVVQLAQITMARLVVEYAAFAAARSAAVWIPASIDDEPANCIGRRYFRGMMRRETGDAAVYDIELVGRKGRRIHWAAASACLSICPSRRVAGPRSIPPGMLDAVWTAYQATTPRDNDPATRRNVLQNKLAYALHNTDVRLEVQHPVQEPPLVAYYAPPRRGEYLPNEIGWRDTLVVTVVHDYALLPGPGRLLATSVSEDDDVASSIRRRRRTYVYQLTATATIANEGQKTTRTYWH